MEVLCQLCCGAALDPQQHPAFRRDHVVGSRADAEELKLLQVVCLGCVRGKSVVSHTLCLSGASTVSSLLRAVVHGGSTRCVYPD